MGLEVLFPNGQVLAVLDYIQDPILGPVKWNGTVIISNIKIPLTPSAPTTVNVGASSAAVIAANANRKGLVLTNLSADNISFGINTAAVLNSGITLTPFGIWVMDAETFTQGAINGISTGTSSILAIQEFT